jgi:TadE-like protein
MSFRREERGQALVEFALVLPLLLLLILGVIEFSFVWNSRNTVQFASRDGSMLAAEGGSLPGTDCLVLNRIEADVVSPARAIRVQEVMIYWADKNGGQIASFKNVYTRTGTITCDLGGTPITVPYTLTTAGYPESTRCDVLAGCGGAHTGVDTVGVQITYRHQWLTSFVRLTGSGVTFAETTATRVEPQL